MTWLVTGGAGYIGAHVVRALADDGVQVVALDDLSTGAATRVDPRATLVEGSVLDGELVRRVLREHEVTGIVHVAAKKQVGESVADPLKYWHENLGGMVSLLEACRDEGVGHVVFSSSSSVYGMPDVELVTEDVEGTPLSPYGMTKKVGEQVLRDCGTAFGLRTMHLRYFNVAGAATPELGDAGAFNLIPMVFERLDAGERPLVFGDDYPTPDGTCIRDYIHVADIALAHVAAARALEGGAASEAYNIGRGEGSSVLEVLGVIGEVTGRDVEHDVRPRRAGDPARVVASVDKIRSGLGHEARHDLREMVESAWAGWQLRTSAPTA